MSLARLAVSRGKVNDVRKSTEMRSLMALAQPGEKLRELAPSTLGDASVSKNGTPFTFRWTVEIVAVERIKSHLQVEDRTKDRTDDVRDRV
jgi:hypothetical protein